MPSNRPPRNVPTTEPAAITNKKSQFCRSTTLIAAVTRQTHKHGRKAHGKRQAASQFDICAEQQRKRRDQKLAAGNSK
jgi:hypothetical protein